MKTKKANLSHIKYVGQARQKRLKKNGITTIAQLDQTPVNQLAAIKSIGKKNALRIKKEVSAYIAKHPLPPQKPVKPKKPSGPPEDQILKKALKKLTRRLNRTDEKLKPLWEKKYLTPYINFKKSAKKLTRRIKPIVKKPGNLSKDEKAILINQTKALGQLLLKDGKKPRKNAFKIITPEINKFSRSLKKYKA